MTFSSGLSSQNPVERFPFPDHNAPHFVDMVRFCQSAVGWLFSPPPLRVHVLFRSQHTWLLKDPKNVVVVHCKAGKGRTGVMICALLLFRGMFSCARDAIKFYDEQRTKDHKVCCSCCSCAPGKALTHWSICTSAPTR